MKDLTALFLHLITPLVEHLVLAPHGMVLSQYRIHIRDDRERVFVSPGNECIEPALFPQFPQLDPQQIATGQLPIETEHEDFGIEITPLTGVPLWSGESMDYSHAVEALWNRRETFADDFYR